MPKYSYEARNEQGQLVKGVIECANEMAAKVTLSDNKMYPLRVTAEKTGQKFKFPFERKPKTKDLANMTRQFQVMFSVGVPMDMIFSTLTKQTHHEGLKNALLGIRKNIGAGVSLSQAFRQYPKYFDLLYVSMIEAGEVGGILAKTLSELAEILDKEHWLKSKIKSAMLYPKLVAVALVIVTIVILAFVIPPLQGVYKQLGDDLPLPTKILLALSTSFRKYWYIYALISGVGFKFFRSWAKSDKGRWLIDYWVIRTPIFGKIVLLTENARFGHLISALYKAGLPFAYGISITANTVTNVCFAKELRLLKEKVNQGSSLGHSMEKARYFTPLIIEMVSVGEQTGRLDQTLESASAFYDEELDMSIKNLTTLIEPILLVGMFGFVMLLALAVYLPIWNLSGSLIKH